MYSIIECFYVSYCFFEVEELTIPGGAGTHRYLAPESHDSHVAAHLADRADVWALGVCLHAMLTGRRKPKSLKNNMFK